MLCRLLRLVRDGWCMLTACGECVGKQAAETRKGMQGTRQYQSLVLFKMQPQEGDEVWIPWISYWLALLGMILGQTCLSRRTPR